MLAKRPSGPLLTQHGANNTKITGFEGLGGLFSIQGFPSTMPHSMADTPHAVIDRCLQKQDPVHRDKAVMQSRTITSLYSPDPG